MKVLDELGYKELFKQPNTIEIHLASALFPNGKITAGRLKKILVGKVPKSGQYKAVVHFGHQLESELTVPLRRARLELPNTQGEWFIMPHQVNRRAAGERVRTLAPKGRVKSSDIDIALASFSKGSS
ncbi:MAG: hypothetical protein V4819_09415 [Verrucomicrobiota bacterium]